MSAVGGLGNFGHKAKEEDVTCLNRGRHIPPGGVPAGWVICPGTEGASRAEGQVGRRTGRCGRPGLPGRALSSLGRGLPLPALSACCARPAGRPTYRTSEAGEIQTGLFIIALHLGQRGPVYYLGKQKSEFKKVQTLLQALLTVHLVFVKGAPHTGG